MKYRWYFSVYGSGLGHISRSLWLAKNIDGEKYFATWGEAFGLASSFYPAYRATPLDVVWTEEGRMSFKKTLKSFNLSFATFFHQIFEEKERIEKIKPDAVISDSRITPLIASRILKAKSALIVNQAKVLFPIRKGVYLALERLFGETLGLFWDLADLVLIPDLPPPYTISKHGADLYSIKKKAIYAGFFSDPPNKDYSCEDEAQIFAPISGPQPTRKILFDLIIKAAKELPEKYKIKVSLGDYSNRNFFYKNGNVTVLGWDYERDKDMACSKALIIRGGLTTIGESILYGKPVISFPIALHGEQEQNAQRVQELGFGFYLDQYKTKPKELAEKLEELIKEDRYRKNAEKLSKIARSINTKERVKKLLEGLVYDGAP